MWTCPVCLQTCTDPLCPECGFDYSTYFQQFPTLQSIPLAQTICSLQDAYKAKHTPSTCLCCGSELTDGHCDYCHFEPLAGTSPEALQHQATQYGQRIVGALTDFSIAVYGYEWTPGKSDLECTFKKIIDPGKTNQFFNKKFWSAERFMPPHNGKDAKIQLRISYKFKGKEKVLRYTIPIVKVNDSWRLGIWMDTAFHLNIRIGSIKKIAESNHIPLDLT